MSWVKEANKLGRYNTTYLGFRIYCIKEPQIRTSHYQREDGIYQRTDFIQGEMLAIDKTGTTFTAPYVENLAFKIDMELLNRYYDRKEARYR
jgi:hypothetical protein